MVKSNLLPRIILLHESLDAKVRDDLIMIAHVNNPNSWFQPVLGYSHFTPEHLTQSR
jgi:hypothetical protein